MVVFPLSLWLNESSNAPDVYTWLSKNDECDICIVGGGLGGLITALRLSENNKNIIIVTTMPIGNGNTSKGSGIADIYTNGGFRRLCNSVGVSDAICYYKKMREGLGTLKEIIDLHNINCDFEIKDVVYFSNDTENYDEFIKEYLPLKHNGFDITVENNKKLSFEIKNGGVALNPYKLARNLANILINNNIKIYENTKIESIFNCGDCTILKSSMGYSIKANKIVLATGLESKNFIKGCGIKKTSYTIATSSINDLQTSYKNKIIHCIDKPYYTCYITNDNRIIATGLDSIISSDFTIKGYKPFTQFKYNKFNQLENLTSELFPIIENTPIEYKFTYSDLENFDDLALCGVLENQQNYYYTISSGVNSIMQSVISADILCSGEPIASDEDNFIGLIN